jgi:putative transposase
VELAHPDLSVRRQCELLGVNRAGLYYQPRGESEENLRLMRLLDEQYTRTPFYGRRRMRAWLRDQGYEVNPKRVARLMELIGVAAIYPKPKLSVPGEGHKTYPYLLEGVEVNRVNQVWSTDITYIRMACGFVYLVAVMDWFSRFVLSWALSVTMEVPFCIEALEKALRWGRPEIFNSDQGSQFTSEKFTGVLKDRDIAVSMDGRGRCLDNIFIERLWRSLKYEEVYLRDYRLVREARAGISRYFQFYNYERPHQSLEYRTQQFRNLRLVRSGLGRWRRASATFCKAGSVAGIFGERLPASSGTRERRTVFWRTDSSPGGDPVALASIERRSGEAQPEYAT